MEIEKGAAKGLAITFIVVESFTLPIFSSGGRSGLSFWGWIVNHTVFGPPVEYVPEEDYARELLQLEATNGVYAISGPSSQSQGE